MSDVFFLFPPAVSSSKTTLRHMCGRACVEILKKSARRLKAPGNKSSFLQPTRYINTPLFKLWRGADTAAEGHFTRAHTHTHTRALLTLMRNKMQHNSRGRGVMGKSNSGWWWSWWKLPKGRQADGKEIDRLKREREKKTRIVFSKCQQRCWVFNRKTKLSNWNTQYFRQFYLVTISK